MKNYILIAILVIFSVSCNIEKKKTTNAEKDEISYLYHRQNIIKDWVQNKLSKEDKIQYQDLHLKIWGDYYCYEDEVALVEKIYTETYKENKNLWVMAYLAMCYDKQRRRDKAKQINAEISSKLTHISKKDKKEMMLLKAIVFDDSTSWLNNIFGLNKYELFNILKKEYPKYADAYFANGQYEKAEKFGLKHPILLTKLGYSERFNKEKLIYFKKALEIEPRWNNALTSITDCYFKENNFKEGLKYATIAANQWNNHWYSIVMKGRCLHALGNYQEALLLFDKIVKYQPKFYWLRELRGMTKAMLKDYEGAITDLNKSYSLRSCRPHVMHKIGLIYNYIGKPNEAIKAFGKLDGLWSLHGKLISNIILENQSKINELLIKIKNENPAWIDGYILSYIFDNKNFSLNNNAFEKDKYYFPLDFVQGKIDIETALNLENKLENKDINSMKSKIYFYEGCIEYKKGNRKKAIQLFSKSEKFAKLPFNHNGTIIKYFLKTL